MSIVILRKICPWFLSDISLYIMHIIITFEGHFKLEILHVCVRKDGQIDD
jgi:hypothetical protein